MYLVEAQQYTRQAASSPVERAQVAPILAFARRTKAAKSIGKTSWRGTRDGRVIFLTSRSE